MIANTVVYTPGALPQQVLALDDRFALLHADFSRQVVADIEAKITSEQMVLSFDVFDTLLLRNYRAELTRFYDVSALVATSLSHQYHKPISTYDVLMARLLANRLSYRLSPVREGCREGTITDIYRGILNQVGVPASESDIQLCIDIELEYEATQLIVNQPLIDLIGRHIQRGGRVIYISDMYLGAVHINQLLSRLGVNVALFAAMYSSADTIVSKRSGKIWPVVLSDLHISAAQLLHIGDSLVSDYQSPRMQGIQSVHLPIPLQMRRDIMADHGAMVHQLESMHLPIQSWMAPPHW
jgi:predicted HAD superfamily hydrolase